MDHDGAGVGKSLCPPPPKKHVDKPENTPHLGYFDHIWEKLHPKCTLCDLRMVLRTPTFLSGRIGALGRHFSLSGMFAKRFPEPEATLPG